MNVDWKFVLGRIAKWPAQDQKKLAEIIDMIEAQNKDPAGEASGGAGARASNWIAVCSEGFENGRVRQVVSVAHELLNIDLTEGRSIGRRRGAGIKPDERCKAKNRESANKPKSFHRRLPSMCHEYAAARSDWL